MSSYPLASLILGLTLRSLSVSLAFAAIVIAAVAAF